MSRVAHNPAIPVISKYLFPDMPRGFLKALLLSVESVDEFQQTVMCKVVKAIVAKTSEGVSFSGIENLEGVDGKFLLVSNHRDIILDPAITQWILMSRKIPMTEICVGSNLLSSKLVEDLLRSNRMIKVIRGISARELYLSSKLLSRYIRESVVSGRSSVWIAQKEGRSKDGIDTTEQGLLKMFDMSGEGSFEDNFCELNIVPMSISYEYESCDSRKAREVLMKRSGPYVKKRREDLHSIMTGIRQQKGHIHLEIEAPLSREEIAKASTCTGNDRYQAIRHTLDNRIIRGYKLWKTNFIAHDMLSGKPEFSHKYTAAEFEQFDAYVRHKLVKLERSLDHAELRKIFLGIYAGPIDSKLSAGVSFEELAVE